MKIKEWNWINYKSYGNTKQSIKLSTDSGELILMVGSNGNGKSAGNQALDFALFGEVQNKQGKRLAKSNFPNRINGNLEVNVIFETDQELQVKRTMENKTSSIKTKLVIDKIPYTVANKIDDKIIEKLGFDYKTFKSFISMDVNNFKNFISLTPEEKRILLDKLFNLEMINDLNKILKQLQKNNTLTFSSLEAEINIYKQNINDLENSLKLVKEKNNDNKKQQLDELKNTLKNNKEKFTNLEIKKNELTTLINELQLGINDLNNQIRTIDRDIRDINEKIDLYKGGKCPTCLNELVGELNLLPEFEERLEKTLLVKEKLNKKIEKGSNGLTTINEEFKNINQEYNNLLLYLTEIKTNITTLTNDKETDLSEFNNNIKLNSDKLLNKNNEYLEKQKLKYLYDILLPIWGESGIKRDIINSIIDPINEFIAEDLVHLKTRFIVELDNNFDAHIYEWGQEIDTESLSTGEAKKINLIIMLAYIKMLRLKRDINILFLDEVFASIDIEGIEDILILFKKFANERNINIFLVHHSELKEFYFDRILNIQKGTFSYIEEKIIN